ncbi:hypothetical protein V9T40_010176 [Parthenolecanium corni]|uniref:Uncharacterized protein n=1 Tax=Parthenolecanium corni TaxID=536013 RepID=A0AAN9TGU2_9HEMI
MHHHPPNQERALNLSIFPVSGPALQPYFPGTEKLRFPGSCPPGHRRNSGGSLAGIVYDENILGKCFRFGSSRDDPRISPLTSRYECPRLSLLIITSGPENRPTAGVDRKRRCVTPAGDRRTPEGSSGRRGRERGAPTGNPRTEAPRRRLHAPRGRRGRDRGPVPLFHATIFRAVRRDARAKRTPRHYRACFEHSNLFKVNVPARPRRTHAPRRSVPSARRQRRNDRPGAPKRAAVDARAERTRPTTTARIRLPAGRPADTPGTITWRNARREAKRPRSVVRRREDTDPTTSFLTATTLIYAIGAGITAAAGTRLALQLILVHLKDTSPVLGPCDQLKVIQSRQVFARAAYARRAREARSRRLAGFDLIKALLPNGRRRRANRRTTTRWSELCRHVLALELPQLSMINQRTDVDSCDTRSATGRRSVERRAADNAPSSPPPTKGDDRRARDSEESTRPPGRVTFFTSVRVCVHTRTSALPGSDVDFRETVRSSDLVRVAG